jgi:predicted RNase H-like nuclease
VCILGVDLAWGDRKADGVCAVEYSGSESRVTAFAYPQGDDEFLTTVRTLVEGYQRVFITVDAPLVCPNRTGTRPVDRLTHRMFHREHAACHPANSTKCPRPPRIRRKLERLGFQTGWDLRSFVKLVAEVYPHPAMVRMFRLPRIVKYKKGTVIERSAEFRRLQRLMRKLLSEQFRGLVLNREAKAVLASAWSKPIEDRLDALFCALIGLWHVVHRGARSEVIGDEKTGFILLPEDLRPPRETP